MINLKDLPYDYQVTLEEAIELIEYSTDGGFIFIKEKNLPTEVVGELIKKYSLFLGPMSPDHWEFKIYNKLGVVENHNWSPINESTMPYEWRKANGLV